MWLALADFGHVPSSIDDDLTGSRNFCKVTMHSFADFPSDKFYDIPTQQRQSVSPCKLSEQNFGNFSIRVFFSKKTQKLLKTFPGLRFQAVITPQ